MDKHPKILLVMHTIPVDSGFLAAKFIKISNQMDVHMLAWDSKKNLEKFIDQNELPACVANKIHLGYKWGINILNVLFAFILLYLQSRNVRRYIWNTDGRLKNKLKLIITYLPALKLEPDIIHFEFGTIAQQATDLKKLTNAKLSVSFRGYDLNYADLNNHNYYDNVWDYFDGFHFLGNDLKRRAVNKGYRPNKMEVLIPPAIDINFFKPVGKDKSEGKLVIVSTGRLVWKKGYEYSVRAVIELKKNNIPFEYRIIGTGNGRQSIQFTINESGLTDEVKLLGQLSPADIKSELESAHIFVHPAISEGFSNAVLEAQAMGVPVICTDADGLTENIEDGVTGFIVSKWDSNAIAEKLIWCWNNRNRLKEMGPSGRERVNKYFKIEDQITAFVNYYKRLAGSEG